MGSKQRIGRVPTDASRPKRRPHSSTPRTADSGGIIPPRPPSRDLKISRKVAREGWQHQIVLYWSDARRTWCFLLEVWDKAKSYEHHFVGRIQMMDKADVDVLKAYLDGNFPGWFVQDIGSWTGVQNWVRAHGERFVASVDYLEPGRYELLAGPRRALPSGIGGAR